MEQMNKVIWGDSLLELKQLPDNSVDSIVTDPPYELGFMGKHWDNSGIAYNVDLWKECLRVLKHGGHLLAFGGTRTYHRMAVAIEDAGFEVRDMIEWVYGSGFPKSLNIGKAIDKMQGNDREVIGINKNGGMSIENGMVFRDDNWKPETRDLEITKGTSEWEGWGTALKPAHEPICMARKPLAEKTVAENVLKYGTGGINIDESRVEYQSEADEKSSIPGFLNSNQKNSSFGIGEGHIHNTTGRFPANLIHDGSDEVKMCFPENKSSGAIRHNKKDNFKFFSEGEKQDAVTSYGFNDSGNASRFFKSIIYQAKASKSERNDGCEDLQSQITGHGNLQNSEGFDRFKTFNQNNHPTVKPIALMEYLIKMVTPKGGIVLDPFAGSGTTLVAAKRNGYKYVGIELTSDYIPIIEARLNAVSQEVLI